MPDPENHATQDLNRVMENVINTNMLEKRPFNPHIKNDPVDPANFRLITLQPVLYKVLASVLRNRIYTFLESNNFVDRRIQKGFWPAVDGVAEHTQMLTHIIRDAKL